VSHLHFENGVGDDNRYNFDDRVGEMAIDRDRDDSRLIDRYIYI